MASSAADIGQVVVSEDPQTWASPPAKARKPKRVVYFSDGVLEEYSETEDEGAPLHSEPPKANPRDLTWLPWFWYYSCKVGKGFLRSADFCGEKIAYFLGITSPKYGYIMREYQRIKEEEEKEKLEREAEELARQASVADRAESGVGVSLPAVSANIPLQNLPLSTLPDGQLAKNTTSAPS